MQPHDVPSITIHELPAGAVLLDVREDEEWAAGHIEGAVHIPMNSVPQQVSYRPEVFEAEAPLVVLCAMGGRSAHVTAWLMTHGIDAVNLEGGMNAWLSAGRPIV
jgi:rhodanese-related sulfurtransferase